MIFSVAKYIPKELYGFLEGNGQRVFFHLSEFDSQGGPPPIVGEPVEVGYIEALSNQSPRARSVTRINETMQLVGNVTRFDHHVGYGFVTVDGEQYFLHRSEFLDGAIPLVGAEVEFYVSGSINGSKRPRACHARLLKQGIR
jgi:cold shock CspA family protein